MTNYKDLIEEILGFYCNYGCDGGLKDSTDKLLDLLHSAQREERERIDKLIEDGYEKDGEGLLYRTYMDIKKKLGL